MTVVKTATWIADVSDKFRYEAHVFHVCPPLVRGSTKHSTVIVASTITHNRREPETSIFGASKCGDTFKVDDWLDLYCLAGTMDLTKILNEAGYAKVIW